MLIEFGSWFYWSMVLSIIVALLLEALLPIDDSGADYRHMLRNFSLWLLAFLIADLVVGVHWLDFSAILSQQAFGLFYWYPPPADWLLILVGVLLMDLLDYIYHRMSHRIGFLWRFHSIHHTDTDLDVSTTLRFHPVDLVLANFWRVVSALLLGLPLWIIAFREVVVFPLLFLQHAKVRLPNWLEHWMGQVFITPAIHRVHHSRIRAEHDSNYGDGLVFWDKLLGTFTRPWADRPERYGVVGFDGPAHQTINGMLLDPFRPRP